MATIAGTALLGKVLGHSDAENAFRPWWNVMEDFFVYGLIMAGLIVAPTAVINSTPLDCNLCRLNYCNGKFEDQPIIPTQSDPGFNAWWIKKYCTVTSIDRFILYFPYILLAIAFLLILIERIFIKMFKANKKIEVFYTLIVKEALEGSDSITLGDSKARIEDSKDIIEVLHSFKDKSNLFHSYLLRTIIEFIVAFILMLWCIYCGFTSLAQEEKFIYCEVHDYYYECAGHHQEFYEIILILVILLLFGYLFCNLYNIMWLLFPCCSGRMKKFMKILSTTHTQNNYKTYYGNRDLRLLLDLLAENSEGVAASLRILGLFDPDLRRHLEPQNITLKKIVGDRDAEIKVKFYEARDAAKLIEAGVISCCLYTVEIKPSTTSSAIMTYASSSEPRINQIVSSNENKSDVLPMTSQDLGFDCMIRDVDPFQKYCIHTSTLINGKVVARCIQHVMETEESNVVTEIKKL